MGIVCSLGLSQASVWLAWENGRQGVLSLPQASVTRELGEVDHFLQDEGTACVWAGGPWTLPSTFTVLP